MTNLPTLFLGAICALFLTSELQEACALNNNDVSENRIIGGNDAQRRQFPYTVSVQYKGEHLCGASILTPLWIISAGHCFDIEYLSEFPDLLDNIQAVAGLLNQKESHPDIQRIKIEQIFTHPGYYLNATDLKLNNDIALGKLVSPLKFTEAVQPINIPQKGQSFQGLVVVDGWGIYIRPGTYPIRLQYLKMKILTNDGCKDLLKGLPPSIPLLDEMICTAPFELYATSCTRDSGGPLAQNNILVGIVSWGTDCTIPLKGALNVFTRVSYYVDFIRQYIPDV